MNKKVKEDCLFCKMLQGNIPINKVYEDDDFIAILDINPANRGHVIMFPKNHADNIFELSKEDADKIFVIVKKIAMAVNEAFDCDGVNILQNNGEAAGQTVNHLHIHVIPRFKNDGISLEWKQIAIDDFEQVRDEILDKLKD